MEHTKQDTNIRNFEDLLALYQTSRDLLQEIEVAHQHVVELEDRLNEVFNRLDSARRVALL